MAQMVRLLIFRLFTTRVHKVKYMYVLNTVITVHFVLAPNGTPPIQSEYDILMEDPLGNTTYVDNGLLTYNPPTASAQGSATYAQLVDILGRWKFAVTIGTDAAYQIYSESAIYVTVPIIGASSTELNRKITVQSDEPYRPL